MRKLEVVEYNPEWPRRFEAERALLSGVLGTVAVEIHHVGSTAVPGLAAKPIIDMVVEVTDLAALDALNADLERIGYEAKSEFGIAGRRYFRKGGDQRTHHVHAFVRGDLNIARHLAFRDYLRAHPGIRQEYGALKKSLAAQCAHDSDRYCAGKEAWILCVEALAMKQGFGLSPSSV